MIWVCIVHCQCSIPLIRYPWFWLAISVTWRMKELLEEIKARILPGSGEIGKFKDVHAVTHA